ncbi:hypothetical protein LL668_04725 [Providencia rettgeri]|nr:hypothetical protein [Providencia rettgeri]UEK61427.1 hypothetical protein LL668_04725 [Providencia rettgeri]
MWAAELMPVELTSILVVAKNAYLTGDSVDWENQLMSVTQCANYLAERIRIYS